MRCNDLQLCYHVPMGFTGRHMRLQLGFSRVEVVCICGIAAACLAVAIAIGLGAYADWRQGNDSIAMNTAQSCGDAALTSPCMVPGCAGDSNPAHGAHLDVHGNSFAYFDSVGNCLNADIPQGYNQTTVTSPDGVSYEPGTAVLIATRTGSTAATVSWTAGR